VVKYPLWVQKLLYYTIQHQDGSHIDFRQMSVSPGRLLQWQDGFQPTCSQEH